MSRSLQSYKKKRRKLYEKSHGVCKRKEKSLEKRKQLLLIKMEQKFPFILLGIILMTIIGIIFCGHTYIHKKYLVVSMSFGNCIDWCIDTKIDMWKDSKEQNKAFLKIHWKTAKGKEIKK